MTSLCNLSVAFSNISLSDAYAIKRFCRRCKAHSINVAMHTVNVTNVKRLQTTMKLSRRESERTTSRRYTCAISGKKLSQITVKQVSSRSRLTIVSRYKFAADRSCSVVANTVFTRTGRKTTNCCEVLKSDISFASDMPLQICTPPQNCSASSLAFLLVLRLYLAK